MGNINSSVRPPGTPVPDEDQYSSLQAFKELLKEGKLDKIDDTLKQVKDKIRTPSITNDQLPNNYILLLKDMFKELLEIGYGNTLPNMMKFIQAKMGIDSSTANQSSDRYIMFLKQVFEELLDNSNSKNGMINFISLLSLTITIDQYSDFLTMAIQKGYNDVVDIMIDVGEKGNKDDYLKYYSNWIKEAIKCGNKGILDLMLDKKTYISIEMIRSDYYIDCLVEAVRIGNKRLVNLMLDKNPDVIKSDGYIKLLKESILTDKHEFFQLLMQRRFPILKYSHYIELIKSASLHDKTMFLEEIISISPKIVKHKEFIDCLQIAVENNNYKIAKLLIERNPDVTKLETYKDLINKSYRNNKAENGDFLLTNMIVQKIINKDEADRNNTPNDIVTRELRNIKYNIEKTEIMKKIRYELALYELKQLIKQRSEDSRLHPDTRKQIKQFENQSLNFTVSEQLMQKINQLKYIDKFYEFQKSIQVEEFLKYQETDRKYLLSLKNIRGYTLLMSAAKSMDKNAIQAFLPNCSEEDISKAFMTVINVSLTRKPFEKPKKSLFNLFCAPNKQNQYTEKQILEVIGVMLEKITLSDASKAAEKLSNCKDEKLKNSILDILNKKGLYSVREDEYVEIESTSVKVEKNILQKLIEAIISNNKVKLESIIDENLGQIKANDFIESLKECVKNDRYDIFESLIKKYPVDKPEQLLECCKYAVSANYYELLDSLIKQAKGKVDISDDIIIDWLNIAAKQGNRETIRVLIEQNPNVLKSKRYIECIDKAYNNKEFEIMDFLVANKLLVEFENFKSSFEINKVDFITKMNMKAKEYKDIREYCFDESNKVKLDNQIKYEKALNKFKELVVECKKSNLSEDKKQELDQLEKINPSNINPKYVFEKIQELLKLKEELLQTSTGHTKDLINNGIQ